MTYKEYDNIFIASSYSPCPSPEAVVGAYELRNNSGVIEGTEMGVPPKDASGINGNTALMLYTTVNFEGACVRNGDYIYIGHAEVTEGFCEVIEYKISTQTTQAITLVNDPTKSAGHILLSIIENRKLLVYSEDDLNIDNVFILDFETLGSTITYNPSTGFTPNNLLVMEKNNDIWLYIISQDGGAYNLEFSYKNYTQNSAWSSFQEVADSYGTTDTILIAERYLAIFYITSSDETIGVVVDTNDNSHGQSNALARPTVTGTQPNWNIYWATPDNINTMGYVFGVGLVETSYPPSKWTSVEQWMKLNPSTKVLTDVYNRVGYDLDTGQTYSPCGLSTRINAYAVKAPENILYKMSDLSVQGTLTIPTAWYSTCHQMDDDGHIWWYQESTKTLYRDALDGSHTSSRILDITQNWGGGNDQQILHAKDSLIMLAHEQQPSSFNHFYRWYYIT